MEVPYGFTRNPSDPLCPANDLNGPRLAAAMKKPPPDTKIVRWKYVEYNLGKIQNDWRLTLRQSNPCDANCEIELYRDDIQVGKSSFLWELDTPRTAVAIRSSDGVRLQGKCMSLRLHEDGMRRSDTFKFFRNPRDRRSWGTIAVTVGEKTYETVLPSSLFKYCHGATEANGMAELK